MKKLFILGLLLTLTQMASAGQAIVTKSEGAPLLIRGTQTLPASQGSICQTGDQIQTSENCLVDLSLNINVGCRVLASSNCAIENAESSSMSLKLSKGNAILNLEKLPKGTSFQVETPTAIAAVRGTQFWGRVNPENPNNPITTFAVRRGQVEVLAKSEGKKFILEAGQALDVPKDSEKPAAMRKALDEEMAAMAQADDVETKS